MDQFQGKMSTDQKQGKMDQHQKEKWINFGVKCRKNGSKKGVKWINIMVKWGLSSKLGVYGSKLRVKWIKIL